MAKRRTFFYALASLVGTMIGAGLFGIPYVGAKSGFFMLFVYLVLLATVTIFINYFYARIAIHVKELHRLPGYARILIGPKARTLAFIGRTFMIFGALLAYLIIGGQFLANLFDGSFYLYTFIFFILGALLIWRGAKSVGPVELVLLVVFLLIVILLLLSGIWKIQITNLFTFEFSNFFLPYGVILFSFGGTAMVPEVKEMLQGDIKKITKVVIWSAVICLIVYFFFSLLVIGLAGAETSKDALTGLDGYLGGWVITIGYIFGIITTFTSFITLGLTAKKVFWYDYKWPQGVAWFVACFVPLFMFIIGLQSFIDVVSLTGAVMVGLNSIIVVWMYLKLKKIEKAKSYRHIQIMSITVVSLLLLGVVLEILYFFNIL